MSFVRTQYSTVYSPRPVSKNLIKSLVDALNTFKTGLPTTSRLLKSKAISHEKITTAQGPECWKVIDTHPLSGLEHLEVELLLTESEGKSCELHVEFRGNHIALSVSDIATTWGSSIHEEMRHLLETLGISLRGMRERVRRIYGLVGILQNVILTVSVAAFALFLSGHGLSYLHASLALFISGSIPTALSIFRYFVPPKKLPLVQESSPKAMNFPITEASAIVALLSGVLQLGKEVVVLLW